jgi:hypothetical protein
MEEVRRPFQRYTVTNEEVWKGGQMLAQSDASIMDASYLRLNNVSFSWNMPAAWMDRLKLKSGVVYLQAQNIKTWTGFKGVYPENQRFLTDLSSSPQSILVAGLRIGL